MPVFDGADISNIQGVALRHLSVDPAELVHWLSGQPSKLAVFKSTQGSSFQDSFFHAWRALAAQLGIRYRGMYHWVTHTASIDMQLANFVAWVGDLQEGECIQLDCEEAGLTEDQIVEAYEKWTARYGKRVLVYVGRFQFGRVIDRHPEWPWWLPWYGPSSYEAMLTMALIKYRAPLQRPPVIWQWGGGAEGISVPLLGGARIDSNQIIDEDQLALLCGYGTTPAPEPVPVPTNVEDDLMVVILAPRGANARFLAVMGKTASGAQVAVHAEWLRSPAEMQPFLNNGVQVVECDISDLANVSVDAVPQGDSVGWSEANFRRVA